MEYNGWRNRATWNVSLWINNDYGLYQSAVGFMKHYKGSKPYGVFINHIGLKGQRTPDGFKWDGKQLDYKALNEMMGYLK